MRKKSITVFLCVYAALCISYCVVSSAMVPDDNDIVFEYSSAKPASKEASEIKIAAYDTNESSNTAVLEYPDESIREYDDRQQSEEQIEEESEDEIIEDKPSLEEFLRGLRCSGCRHNCTLFSPRCMNGARKASRAESQYYEMYGE